MAAKDIKDPPVAELWQLGLFEVLIVGGRVKTKTLKFWCGFLI